MTLVLSSDVACADAPTTSVAVSRSNNETIEPSMVTQVCQPDGHIGTLVVVPAEHRDEDLRVRAVTGIRGSSCEPPSYGPGCIVSRRQLRFIAHEELTVPIAQQVDCAGIACEASTTCRKGSCVDATVDQDQCKANPGQCGIEITPPTGGTGGAGGAGAAGGISGAAGQGGAGGVTGGSGQSGAGQGGVSGASGAGQAGQGGAGQGGAGQAGAGQGGAGMSGGSGQAGAGQGGAGAAGEGGESGVGGRSVLGVASTVYSNCAWRWDGTAQCWGGNQFGQLGRGNKDSVGSASGQMGASLAPIDLGAGLTITVLSAGVHHTCARLVNGRVKCWGLNTDGQLGLGDKANRGDDAGEMGDALPAVNLGTLAIVSIVVAGGNSTCAIRADGQLQCWGKNDSGQLGLGDTVNRGVSAGQMGAALPIVNLGTGVKIRQLEMGDAFVCTLSPERDVRCWGQNLSGQLGYGDTNNRGDNAGEMGDALQVVDLGPQGGTIEEVVVGQSHACARRADGSVQCWGNNAYGQLGRGDSVPSWGDKPGQMGANLPRVDLGTTVPVSYLSARDRHTCALFADGQVKCWGANESGQLGLGDKTNRGDKAGQMGDNLPFVSIAAGMNIWSVFMGSFHTCASFAGASLKCWGNNTYGQLGLGDTTPRGDNAGEMGAALPFVDLGP